MTSYCYSRINDKINDIIIIKIIWNKFENKAILKQNDTKLQRLLPLIVVANKYLKGSFVKNEKKENVKRSDIVNNVLE